MPDKVAADDLAFVALHDSQSALGTDGYAFPLMLRGSLLGALVVTGRPSEHFAADERALLFHVAHEVGMALFALRAQASEAQARATENQLMEARARESVHLTALSALGSATSK